MRKTTQYRKFMCHKKYITNTINIIDINNTKIKNNKMVICMVNSFVEKEYLELFKSELSNKGYTVKKMILNLENTLTGRLSDMYLYAPREGVVGYEFYVMYDKDKLKPGDRALGGRALFQRLHTDYILLKSIYAL